MASERVLTRQELIDKVKSFPGDVHITGMDGDQELKLVTWVNGHCFMWTRPNANVKWNCEEL